MRIARSLGIVQGQTGGAFNGTSAITRQDLMVVTARALQLVGKLEKNGKRADLTRFADSGDISGYAADSIGLLTAAGLVYGDGARINPIGRATRAEAAVLMYRIYQIPD
ncbi:hypothetical protein B1A99_25915 [Cohnella sp. CIP 111063]|nr:hypothetical protein B1A99_25915 [Cohnella sp. CIP 111063]PRX64602.1 S-layer family protein [Cohnella sp. SGD-V74]